jgi:dihydropteroate synthase
VTLPFRLMGVVNVTPDSFSDGGAFLDAGAAIAHARTLALERADILDVGGESTRPGAEPVSDGEELRRVLPVLEGIAAAGLDVEVSIDTSKASVARAAIDAGAVIVNDVSALRGDPQMAELIAERRVECCLMHMLGEPRTMQREPRYEDVVDEVKAFLEERMSFAVRAGVAEERIMLDPGIGFGKTLAHNLELLRRLGELVALGRPLVVGTSRKSFIGRILAKADASADTDTDDDAAGETEPVAVVRRAPGTIATNVLALERGASVFRVHDVAPVRDALAVAAATLGERWTARGTTTRTS